MKKFLLMVAVVIMTAVSAEAQKIEVVDSNGHGIPLVSVLAEDGNLIGTTDLNGIVDNVKGAKKVALTHVAYKPQLVTVAALANGRVTMEDNDYDLDEIVVKPKPYVYVETLYRVYVYRNDSLCYFMSGIMPNAYNVQKKKLEHGSYYQARAEYCANWGASITWGARAERYGAGKVVTKSLENSEQQMKEKYFVTTTVNSPSHSTYSNPQGIVGQLTRTNGQVRMTIDAGKAQIYANEANGQNRKLKLRQEKDYEYQFILVWEENEEHTTSAENFIMDSNHWEYNDKKSHVKFFIENYATDHYYMDQEEWKARKKAIKEEYGSSMTLEQVAEYERKHNVPELSPVTIQAIGKLKSQW